MAAQGSNGAFASEQLCQGRLSHLGDAQIDAVGEYGGEQQDLIFRRLASFQMSEVLAETVARYIQLCTGWRHEDG